jgi:hypothetical protein
VGLALNSFLPESPKWLLKEQRYKECHEVLTKMLSVNQGMSKSKAIDSLLLRPKHSMMNVETWPDLRPYAWNLICMLIIWGSCSFCYYLISFQLKYIKGNIFTNTIISGSIEIVAYITSAFFLKKFGLKTTFVASFAMAFFGMLAIMKVSDP